MWRALISGAVQLMLALLVRLLLMLLRLRLLRLRCGCCAFAPAHRVAALTARPALACRLAAKGGEVAGQQAEDGEVG